MKKALAPLKGENFDALIMGCTHYPLISHFIQEVVGPDVKLINSAEEAASELSAVLSHRSMLANGGDVIRNHHRFFTSGSRSLFNSIARDWLSIHVEAEICEFRTNGIKKTWTNFFGQIMYKIPLGSYT